MNFFRGVAIAVPIGLMMWGAFIFAIIKGLS